MHSKLEVFGGRGLVLTLIGVLNGPIPIAFTACTLILKNVNVIHGSTIYMYLKKKKFTNHLLFTFVTSFYCRFTEK